MMLKVLGVILILVGIAGLILPVVPGALLIIIGCSLFLEKSVKDVFGYIKSKFKEKQANR